ncbi:MAG: RelA/SpoT family protein [Burkholderiaceae bacterium]
MNSNVPEHQRAREIDALVDHLDPLDGVVVRKAWDFAETLYGAARLPTGEAIVEHALGTVRILDAVRADAPARAAGFLFSAAERLTKPEEQLKENFGDEIATIAIGVRQLARVGIATRPLHRTVGGAEAGKPGGKPLDAKAIERQAETLRKMVLAFSTDIRVVLVRLASRLQTLRWYAENKTPLAEWTDPDIARESLELYAPLANRLGVWQIKWQIEDLAFRFLDPDAYKRAARMLDQKRGEREAFIQRKTYELHALLASAGIDAAVTGRPKHLYSIVGKMQAKKLAFENLYDVRALRVIVADEAACYATLSVVHGRWHPLPAEFDDYIAKAKENGYRSIHTIVRDEEDRPFEIQIRTREMHRFAEYGVAAHWRYKEGGSSARASDRFDERIAWLRQLFAWRSEIAGDAERGAGPGPGRPGATQAGPPPDERIYVLTPEARVIELPMGATPIDFAYHVHSDLGDRCRGARVDGALVPLNTALKTGQTVEIITAKPSPTVSLEALGPSRDWLNPQLAYLQSPRARAKVRQWFNARELEATLAAGRALVEKTLQQTTRGSGKAMPALDELAARLGFAKADELFAAVAKDEIGPRQLGEAVLEDGSAKTELDIDDMLRARKSGTTSATDPKRSGVLVVGVDALLTQLAKCCKPAPPDAIAGFVTRGRGVSIHRSDCSNLAAMRERDPERMIDVDWGDPSKRGDAVYPVDVHVSAQDRQGLLRDISEVFSREKINVVAVQTESRKGMARMAFTAEVGDARLLQKALVAIGDVKGVVEAKRK